MVVEVRHRASQISHEVGKVRTSGNNLKIQIQSIHLEINRIQV